MNRVQKQENSVSGKESSHVSNPLPLNLSEGNWAKAAEDARVKIAEHQKKIRLLRQAARVFEKYAEEGHAWPGENRA
jgi:hypothetical protein